jgi:hypothetical protein
MHLARLTAFLLLASFLPTACAGDSSPQGTRVSDEQLCRFHYGTTTPADVSQVLGPPSTSGTSGSDLTFTMYQYQDPGKGLSETITFVFQTGVLYEVTRTSVGGPAVADVPACLGTPSIGAGR